MENIKFANLLAKLEEALREKINAEITRDHLQREYDRTVEDCNILRSRIKAFVAEGE